MKTRAIPAAILLCLLPAIGFAQSKESLVGTWKLISAKDTNEKGDVTDSFGKSPSGLITYTADGRMMVIIDFDQRKTLSVPDYISAPPRERAEAFATFVAYAGTYKLQGDKVIHHVEVASLQNRVNTDNVRTIVSVKDGRLVLRTPPILRGGVMVTQELVWERISNGTVTVN